MTPCRDTVSAEQLQRPNEDSDRGKSRRQTLCGSELSWEGGQKASIALARVLPPVVTPQLFTPSSSALKNLVPLKSVWT